MTGADCQVCPRLYSPINTLVIPESAADARNFRRNSSCIRREHDIVNITLALVLRLGLIAGPLDTANSFNSSFSSPTWLQRPCDPVCSVPLCLGLRP
jgi:hypothetical protein